MYVREIRFRVILPPSCLWEWMKMPLLNVKKQGDYAKVYVFKPLYSFCLMEPRYSSETVYLFKKHLKTHYFKLAFNTS